MGYTAKIVISGRCIPLVTADLFRDFRGSILTNETTRPPYQWLLGGATEQPRPHIVRANDGPIRVPKMEKLIASKLIVGATGRLKQLFFGGFDPMVLAVGQWKIPKSPNPNMSRFETKSSQKRVKIMFFQQ